MSEKPHKRGTLRLSLLGCAMAVGLAVYLIFFRNPRGDSDAPPGETKFAGLSDAKQKWVWDLEHFTFELETKFGKPFTAALAARDEKKLARFFRSDFTARIPALDKRTENQYQWWKRNGWNTATRDKAHREEGMQWEDASADQLVTHLLDYLKEFQSVKKAKLRVLQIDSDPPGKGGDRWNLTLFLTAEGRNAEGGPISLASTHHVACNFLSDEDIEDGRIVAEWKIVSDQVRSAPKPFFAEATKDYSLDTVPLRDNWRHPDQDAKPYTFLTAVDDFDQDGHLDIAIATWSGKHYLLRSDKGKSFQDVTGTFAVPRSRKNTFVTLATSIDYDNDGFPDLLLGTSLLHNVGGKYFEDVTAKSRLTFRHLTMGAVVADYDGDGHLDIYVLNHHPPQQSQQVMGYVDDDDKTGSENQLWRNRGDGSFEDVTAKAGVGGSRRHSYAGSWFFANADALPDLYVANDFGRNQLYINRGDGTFDEKSGPAGVSDFATSMGVATGDLDGNGENEIYVANMYSKMGRRIIAHVGPDDYPDGLYNQIQGSCQGNRAYRLQGEKLVYSDISQRLNVNEVGWAYAPVITDFDGDGRMDLYVASGYLSFDRKKPDG